MILRKLVASLVGLSVSVGLAAYLLLSACSGPNASPCDPLNDLTAGWFAAFGPPVAVAGLAAGAFANALLRPQR